MTTGRINQVVTILARPAGWFGAGGGVGEGKPPPETETETETENPAAPSKRMCQKAGKR